MSPLTIDTISVQLRRGASHIPLKMVFHFRFDGYTLLGVCQLKWKLKKLNYIILDSKNLIQIMARKGKDNFKQLSTINVP